VAQSIALAADASRRASLLLNGVGTRLAKRSRSTNTSSPRAAGQAQNSGALSQRRAVRRTLVARKASPKAVTARGVKRDHQERSGEGAEIFARVTQALVEPRV